MTKHLNRFEKLKLKLESGRIFLMVGILIFLFIYASLGIYLKVLARDAVDQAIAKIEATDPNITNIKYRHLVFSPLDFLKQQLMLEGVTFHLNNPDINVEMDSLTLQHFMSFTKNPLGPFTVSFTGAHIDRFNSLYGMITTWLNNPYLYSELGSVPDQLDLNLDGNANYMPDNHHAINLTFTLKNKNFQLFTYDIAVNNLNLTADFFNNMPTFLAALQQSQILHMHYQANINYVVNLNEIANIAPGFAQYLQNLGYQNFPINLSGSSDYNAQDTQETYYFNVAAKNVGTVVLAINYQILNPPSLSKSVNQILGTYNNNQTLQPDLIQSASLVYKDDSLVSRILQNMARTSGGTLQDTQNEVIDMINDMAQNLNIPQMTNIATQLDNFILNPGTLTINLQPSTPFSIDDIANFFMAQQARNQIIQQSVSKLSADARTKVYNAYLQQSLNAYSMFFNRIGLSVTANNN